MLIGLYIILVETLAKTRAVKWYQQFRVIAGAMQAFPVIFYYQFPVAGFKNIFLAGYFGFGEFVWSEIWSQHGAHGLKIIGCGRGKANINKSTDHSDLYWIQSKIFFGKSEIHTAGMQ